jgi:hypothetical protein
LWVASTEEDDCALKVQGGVRAGSAATVSSFIGSKRLSRTRAHGRCAIVDGRVTRYRLVPSVDHIALSMHVPPAAWVTAAVIAIILCALCVLTVHSVLRRSSRARLAQWPMLWVLALIVIAVMPWIVVRVAPISIEVNIRGALQLAGWILAALIAFALLVLLPIAALVAALVWWTEWRRRRKPLSPP